VESLQQRLVDDSPLVVTAVLDLPTETLFQRLSEDTIIEKFFQILKLEKSGWQKVKLKVLKLLCSEHVAKEDNEERNIEILLTVLPYLFPVAEHRVILTTTIIQSYFGSSNSFTSSLLSGE